MRRTLTNGGSDDMVAADELNGDASSPRHSLEVVGVQGRVHEMVLRFSVLNFGWYSLVLFSVCVLCCVGWCEDGFSVVSIR